MPRGRAPSPTSNRTDQLSPAPVTTVPGQQYGEAAQQQAAQQAIPTANGPTMAVAQAPQGGGPPQPGALDQMAQAHNGPGDSMSLTRPTERPNEPVTHGLPVGPGGGPEALTGVGAAARNSTIEQGTLKNLLSNMAAAPGASSAIQDLAARAAAGVM